MRHPLAINVPNIS